MHKHPSHRPVLGPYVDVIDTWLLEDGYLPRKQRHTASRIFHRLREEYWFKGGIRTVSTYVAIWKQQMVLEQAERYECLDHPGGEAQADFGNTYIFKAGAFVERKVLTLSFPYPRKTPSVSSKRSSVSLSKRVVCQAKSG